LKDSKVLREERLTLSSTSQNSIFFPYILMNSFTQYGLRPVLVDALDAIGYKTATPIQHDVLTQALTGKHVVGMSQTGTGKTAAFVLPILHQIDPMKRQIQALIIAPTRELVTQIREEVVSLSGEMRMASLALYGGTNIRQQMRAVERNPQVIVSTPGRLMDMQRRGLQLDTIKFFVLDEVDRMLDMGFVDDIEDIWASCPNITQNFCFSATVTKEVSRVIEKHLGTDYAFIKPSDLITVDKIAHSFTPVEEIHKYDFCCDLLQKAKDADESVMVFVETKRMTEELAHKFRRDGFEAAYINGDMMQRERFSTIRDYKEKYTKILVTTDVAARGLNLGHIHLVINYEVPRDPESYIHRIGRTGRAGADGLAVMLVSRQEYPLVINIEKSNHITVNQSDENGKIVERTVAVQNSGSYSGSGSGRGRGRGFGRGRGGFGGGRG